MISARGFRLKKLAGCGAAHLSALANQPAIGSNSWGTRFRSWVRNRSGPSCPLTELRLHCTIIIEQWGKKIVFQINTKDPMPIYAQLESAIRLAIATGQLDLGDRLPTVRQLAVELRINANTVAKVYGELERAGVLETRRGVGTFVAVLQDKVTSDTQRTRHLTTLGDRFLAEARTLGFTAREALESLKQRLHEGKNNHGSLPDQET
jgi:GntR family transcriptional regulator